MRRSRVQPYLVSCLILACSLPLAGCGGDVPPPDPEAVESDGSANEDGEASPVLSEEEAAAVIEIATKLMAAETGLSAEVLDGRVDAQLVLESGQAWARALVWNTDDSEGAEPVFLARKADSGEWSVLTHGSETEWTDLAFWGVPAPAARRLFYDFFARRVAEEKTATDAGASADAYQIMDESYAGDASGGLWARLEVDRRSNPTGDRTLVYLEWDVESGLWTVLGAGPNVDPAMIGVPDETAERLR